MASKSYSQVAADGQGKQHNGDVINNYSSMQNARSYFDTLSQEKRDSLLHAACVSGQHRRLELLIKANANIDMEIDGSSAMHEAASQGHNKCIMLLIQAGADIALLDKQQRPPVHLAIINNHVESAATLIEAGARVKSNGFVPGLLADIAAQREDPRMVDLLARHGVQLTKPWTNIDHSTDRQTWPIRNMAAKVAPDHWRQSQGLSRGGRPDVACHETNDMPANAIDNHGDKALSSPQSLRAVPDSCSTSLSTSSHAETINVLLVSLTQFPKNRFLSRLIDLADDVIPEAPAETRNPVFMDSCTILEFKIPLTRWCLTMDPDTGGLTPCPSTNSSRDGSSMNNLRMIERISAHQLNSRRANAPRITLRVIDTPPFFYDDGKTLQEVKSYLETLAHSKDESYHKIHAFAYVTGAIFSNLKWHEYNLTRIESRLVHPCRKITTINMSGQLDSSVIGKHARSLAFGRVTNGAVLGHFDNYPKLQQAEHFIIDDKLDRAEIYAECLTRNAMDEILHSWSSKSADMS